MGYAKMFDHFQYQSLFYYRKKIPILQQYFHDMLLKHISYEDPLNEDELKNIFQQAAFLLLTDPIKNKNLKL